MITLEKLAELRPYLIYDADFVDLGDTLEAALKCVRCLASHDDLSPFDEEALAPFRSQPEGKRD